MFAPYKLKLALKQLERQIDRITKDSYAGQLTQRTLTKRFAIGAAAYLAFFLIIFIGVSLVTKPNRQLPPLSIRILIYFGFTTPLIGWGIFIYIVYPWLVKKNHRILQNLADILGIYSLKNVLLGKESQLVVDTLPWYPSEGLKAIRLFVAGSIQDYPLVMMECRHILDPARKYFALKLVPQKDKRLQHYAIISVLFLSPAANWPDLFMVPANTIIAAYVSRVKARKVALPKELADDFIAVSNNPHQAMLCLQNCAGLIEMLNQDKTLHLQILGGHLFVWNITINRPISSGTPFEGPLPTVAKLQNSVEQALRVRQALARSKG